MQTHPQLHDIVTQVHYLIVRNCENLKHRVPFIVSLKKAAYRKESMNPPGYPVTDDVLRYTKKKWTVYIGDKIHIFRH